MTVSLASAQEQSAAPGSEQAASDGFVAPSAAEQASAYFAAHPGARSTPVHGAIVTPPATPAATCGPGSLPEVTQGRVPLADYSNGRALKGYQCNATEVAHTGRNTGGYRVNRYTDAKGHSCVYYDSTLFFGVGTLAQGEFGTIVVDVTQPNKPIQTARLTTPGMYTPHEGMSLSRERGLLMAASANNGSGPAIVDIYSLVNDCRYPVLLSSSPYGLMGHEGAVSGDGDTYWVSSNIGILAAVDITNPELPGLAYFSVGEHTVHGLSLSADGKTLYAAQIGDDAGLLILDVSEVQARKPAPTVKVISHLTWPTVAVPQTTIPIFVHGHPYLVEVDEFTKGVSGDPKASVGAARIIDIADVKHPFVASDLRLQVNQPSARQSGSQKNDPNAQVGFSGYAAHYCGVPRTEDPMLVACSFIASGLRVFNIEDPTNPREVAYFNRPQDKPSSTSGAGAMSQPAFDIGRHQIWYADGNFGLFGVQITNDAWPAGLTGSDVRARATKATWAAQASKLADTNAQRIAEATNKGYGLIYQLMDTGAGLFNGR